MTIDEKSFLYLAGLVKNTMGIKMPPEKKQLMETRLAKRLRILNLESFPDYCDYLRRGDANSKKELINFCNSISTNKTDFFREIGHFEYLRNVILPEFQKKGKRELNIWSCASSSGEELYTIAMEIEEYKAKHHYKLNYSVLGTDISTKVLQTAKDAIYTEANVDTIPFSGFKDKYFELVDAGKKKYRVKQSLRNNVKLGTFNLMSSNYNLPGPFDIVFCRNVLIYFDREKQKFIINNLLKKLGSGGHLFLGHSESMAGMNFDLKSCAPAVFKKM
jgi:chemotaxis protein methyltransferase CheR